MPFGIVDCLQDVTMREATEAEYPLSVRESRIASMSAVEIGQDEDAESVMSEDLELQVLAFPNESSIRSAIPRLFGPARSNHQNHYLRCANFLKHSWKLPRN